MAQQIVSTAVFGMTGSGKSQLVKYLLWDYDHMTALIHDPPLDEGWNDFSPAVHTADETEYLQWYWGSENCVCIHDECHESIGLNNKALIATATRGRHQGHRNFYISQTVIGLASAVWGQCQEIYAFRCGIRDGKALDERFDCPPLAGCNRLKQYEFFHLVVWGDEGRPVLYRGQVDGDVLYEEKVEVSSWLPAAVDQSEKGGESA